MRLLSNNTTFLFRRHLKAVFHSILFSIGILFIHLLFFIRVPFFNRIVFIRLLFSFVYFSFAYFLFVYSSFVYFFFISMLFVRIFFIHILFINILFIRIFLHFIHTNSNNGGIVTRLPETFNKVKILINVNSACYQNCMGQKQAFRAVP